MIKPKSAFGVSPECAGLIAVKGVGWDSQRLPDIPGLPDRDSVEEWLSLPLNARRTHVSAGRRKYVIFIGSSL
jgi:hypothetical protein